MTILMLLATSPVVASATPKAGETCTRAGKVTKSSAKVFTCTKVGKRLIWVLKKPVRAAVATSSPMPSPTLSKYVSPVRDDVSKAIDEMRLAALQSADLELPDIDWHIQGSSDDLVAVKTKRSLVNALPVFAKFGFLTTDSRVFVPKDFEWLEAQFAQHNCEMTTRPGSSTGFYIPLTCDRQTGAVVGWHWDVMRFADGIDGLFYNHTFPHEYFHHIQHELRPQAGDFPRWFWEGSAQFFTNQAWTTWNPTRGYVEWFEYWWSDLRPDLGPSACRSATIEQLSDPATPGVQGVCVYSKGQLLVELLVARYGLEDYRALYSATAPRGWKGFEVRFKAVTGDDLDGFYREAESFMARRGW